MYTRVYTHHSGEVIRIPSWKWGWKSIYWYTWITILYKPIEARHHTRTTYFDNHRKQCNSNPLSAHFIESTWSIHAASETSFLFETVHTRQSIQLDCKKEHDAMSSWLTHSLGEINRSRDLWRGICCGLVLRCWNRKKHGAMMWSGQLSWISIVMGQ